MMFHCLQNKSATFPIKTSPHQKSKAKKKMRPELLSPLQHSKCEPDGLHEDSQTNQQEVKLGSVHQYINSSHHQEPLWTTCKNNGQLRQHRRYDIAEAERILLDSSQGRQEKIAASKIIAETTFKSVYGERLKRIEQEQRQKENTRPREFINLTSLEVVMSEMEHNPRSQSIMLRKEELEKLWEFGKPKTRRILKRVGIEVQVSNIQIMHNLKNQYSSLKGVIIPTKSQEYDTFASFYSQPSSNRNEEPLRSSNSSSGFFKNLLSDLRLSRFADDPQSKQAESFQKFKAYKHSSSVIKHCPSRFVRTNQELTLENVAELKPPIFMFLLSQSQFRHLRSIRLKCLRIDEDLLFLFLDYLRAISGQVESIQAFQLSSISVQNRMRFSEKLSLLLKDVPLRTLKLESMDLCTSDFNRIAYGLAENKSIEEVSLRHNRIDILGVRSMEILAKTLPRLKVLDVRNNDIPHYANLKDKSSLILFF